MKIERKFYFSAHRLSLFESCLRAYYYRYIASWNGWDRAASQEVREIYFLKNLVSENSFLYEILKKSFNIFITEKSLGNKDAEFPRIALNEYRKTFNLYIQNSKKFLLDGKNKTLSQLYYKNYLTVENLDNTLRAKLQKLIAIFARSSFFLEYSETPFLQLRNLNEPESYQYSNAIQIYLLPLTLKIANGSAEITLLHLNSFQNTLFWDLSATIAENFVQKKIKINSVNCRSLFYVGDKLLSVWAAKTQIETDKLIKEKTEEMLSFEKNTREIPPVKHIERCNNCEFRKLCSF